jgi:hypothetical protein
MPRRRRHEPTTGGRQQSPPPPAAGCRRRFRPDLPIPASRLQGPSGSHTDTSTPPTSPSPGPRRGGMACPPPSQTGPAAKGRRSPDNRRAHLSLTKLHWNLKGKRTSSLHAWEGRGDYQENDYNRVALCSPVPTQARSSPRASGWRRRGCCCCCTLLSGANATQPTTCVQPATARSSYVTEKRNMKFRCHKLV